MSALKRWTQLDGERQSFLRRCENYSGLTVPRICTPIGYNQNNNSLQHDWNSIGSQCVINLTNKLMLALFAPANPFFRLETNAEADATFSQAGLDAAAVRDMMSKAEKDALKVLDKKSLRPKLQEVLMNLVVTGNVLFCLDKKPRVIGIKKYVAKRDVYSNLIELVTQDTVKVSQLDKDILTLKTYADMDQESMVNLYKWIVKDGDDFKMTQWIDDQQLPKKFDGKWPEDKMPYRVLTWSLADGDDYGTGHVEDYCGELEAISTLSKAETQAAVLASEFRWLVNPSGVTSPEDMEDSENGAAIPGMPGDINLVSTGTTSALPAIQAILAARESRLARGFLLGSGQVRNAERVTAEEIRMQANELETALGGAYSRIAVDLQIPFCYYLLKEINITIDGKKIEPVIITGLDSLSRNAEMGNMTGFASAMIQFQNVPPAMMESMNMKSIISILAAGFGVNSKDFMLSDEQIQANQMARQQAQMQGAEGPQPGVSQDPATVPQAPPQ